MPIAKIPMKEQMGIRDFAYSKVTTNTREEYEAGEVKSGGWLARVSQNVTETITPIWRDNQKVKSKRSIPSKEIIFDVSLLPYEVRQDLLGENVTEDGVMFGGGGVRTAPLVAVSFIMGDTEDDEEYVWFLCGTFSLPSREANTRNDGADSNGQELVFTPEDTLKVWSDGKTHDSVSCMSTNETYGQYLKTKWQEQVITPDNYRTVLVAGA